MSLASPPIPGTGYLALKLITETVTLQHLIKHYTSKIYVLVMQKTKISAISLLLIAICLFWVIICRVGGGGGGGGWWCSVGPVGRGLVLSDLYISKSVTR